MKEMKDILPESLYNTLKEIYTPDELLIIQQGMGVKKRRPTFRINTLKAHATNTIEALKTAGLKVSPISYIKNAYILDEGSEKDLWNTGAFKAGYIYMQGISSMIPPLLFSELGEHVLDMTAAPGSKTSQLSAIMSNKGKIIAIDNNQIRIDKLEFTLKRQGCKNVTVMKTDARKLPVHLEEHSPFVKQEGVEGFFDSILFDAPCSAEGRINLNIEKTYAFWNDAIPKKNYKLQRDIIRNNAMLLKQGGELVYSTCTLSPLENEGMVHFILSNCPDLEIIDIADKEIFSDMVTKPGITHFGKTAYRKEVTKAMRILPTSEYEGFFVAKFRKKAI